MDEYKIPVVALVGPTASGKTSLAVQLCRHYGGEVVSADSMQIYEGFDISTAKPSPQEFSLAKHHLIGFVPPCQPFSVADYCECASSCIKDLYSRGKKVILCGGTGLYVSSLLENLTFSGEGAHSEVRSLLKQRAEKEGSDVLLEELHKIDPQTAQTLHVNNVGRIVRALEIYMTSGITMSEQKRLSHQNPSPYEPLYICLDAEDRQYLYSRINTRVDKMLDDGLLQEARDFYSLLSQSGDATLRQAIGCKELIPYFEGALTLTEAIENIKRSTRRYAKRQLTWFNKLPDVHKLYIDKTFDIARDAIKIIDDSGIFSRADIQ